MTRLVNLWNKLDEKIVEMDTVEKFKRKPSDLGYQDTEVVHSKLPFHYDYIRGVHPPETMKHFPLYLRDFLDC